jgi:hypothetical protein
VKASQISKEKVLQLLKTGESFDSPWPMEELNDQDFVEWFDMDAKEFYRQTKAILKHLNENGQ